MADQQHDTGDGSQGAVDRRTVLKAAVVAGTSAAVGVPVTYRSGATDSGSPELTTTATVPSGTSLTITGYEDVDGDGDAENQVTEAIEDGEHTYVLSGFTGSDSSENWYWWEVDYTGDGTATPQLEPLVVTMPALSATDENTTEEPGDQPDSSGWFDQLNPFDNAGFGPFACDEAEADYSDWLDKLNPFNEAGLGLFASDDDSTETGEQSEESFWDFLPWRDGFSAVPAD